jgi:hypothetical protein
MNTLCSAWDRRSPRRAVLQKEETWLRAIFVFAALISFTVLRVVDPVVACAWLPLHASCGEITGLPCIFCGMTRALHFLFDGDFGRAFYFNWLSFPFVAAVTFTVALFTIELACQRRFLNLRVIGSITPRKLLLLTIAGITLWTFQAGLALSQHKTGLLNPRGLFYPVLAR